MRIPSSQIPFSYIKKIPRTLQEAFGPYTTPLVYEPSVRRVKTGIWATAGIVVAAIIVFVAYFVIN